MKIEKMKKRKGVEVLELRVRVKLTASEQTRLK